MRRRDPKFRRSEALAEVRRVGRQMRESRWPIHLACAIHSAAAAFMLLAMLAAPPLSVLAFLVLCACLAISASAAFFKVPEHPSARCTIVATSWTLLIVVLRADGLGFDSALVFLTSFVTAGLWAIVPFTWRAARLRDEWPNLWFWVRRNPDAVVTPRTWAGRSSENVDRERAAPERRPSERPVLSARSERH